MRHFKIQRHRTEKLFAWEWVPDHIDGLMVASVTLFGISFVWLGTAAPPR